MERADGRKADELRPLVIKAGVVPNANGSALVSLGKTTAIAAVYGPRPFHPKRLQVFDRAILTTKYSMLPFSTKERVRPGPSRRSMEICKVTRQSLEPAIFLEEFPKTGIDVFIDIIQANAGTRTVGINAASVALADAGIPMRDLVASVAAGKIENEYVLDLAGKEEDTTACDLPIAYMPRKKQVTLMQLDGDLSAEDVKKVMQLAIKGCEQVYEKQKEALRKRWIK
jgi:exosome complex component RRP41